MWCWWVHNGMKGDEISGNVCMSSTMREDVLNLQVEKPIGLVIPPWRLRSQSMFIAPPVLASEQVVVERAREAFRQSTLTTSEEHTREDDHRLRQRARDVGRLVRARHRERHGEDPGWSAWSDFQPGYMTWRTDSVDFGSFYFSSAGFELLRVRERSF